MEIKITNQGYEPNNIIIEPNNQVIWKNEDQTPHSITADDGHSFNSPTIEPGQDFEIRLREKGIYGYHDKSNPDLKGEISVSNVPSSE